MRVEKQGHKECMLATIAALTGELLADVRYVALELTGAFRWACVTDEDTFWSAVSDIMGFLGQPDLRPHVCLRRDMANPTSSIRLLDLYIDALPAQGRGAIVVRGGPWSLHIMPWENGHAYDPNHPKIPLTLATIREMGAVIERISCETPEDR